MKRLCFYTNARVFLCLFSALFLMSPALMPQLLAQGEPVKKEEPSAKPGAVPQQQAVPEAPAEKTVSKEAEAEKATDLSETATTPAPAPDTGRWTPFQLALFHPAQIFSKKYSVEGFNWNFIYSRNVRVYGFDMSPTGATQSVAFAGLQIAAVGLSKEMDGFQIAIFGDFSRKARGLQICPIDVSCADTELFSGCRISGIGTVSNIDLMNGALISPVSSDTGTMNGVQFGAFYCGSESANGVQFGAGFNRAEELNGLQIGFFNYSGDLSGFQIGVLNYSPDNWLPIFIGINFGF